MNITGFTPDQKQALLDDLLTSDSRVTSEESQLLSAVREVFQL